MNHKGLPCVVLERKGIYKLCQEGDCDLCNISREKDRLTEKQLDDLKSMREAYKGRNIRGVNYGH